METPDGFAQKVSRLSGVLRSSVLSVKRSQAGRNTAAVAVSSSAPSRTFPSDEAANGSLARSGWGMSPTTFPSAFEMAAIAPSEPLGLSR